VSDNQNNDGKDRKIPVSNRVKRFKTQIKTFQNTNQNPEMSKSNSTPKQPARERTVNKQKPRQQPDDAFDVFSDEGNHQTSPRKSSVEELRKTMQRIQKTVSEHRAHESLTYHESSKGQAGAPKHTRSAPAPREKKDVKKPEISFPKLDLTPPQPANPFLSKQGRGINSRSFIVSGYEWMIARRYLRTRRKEGFVSVIAGFSLVGIALGVATLIIVMAVMNGFRIELVSRILGVNGHITAYAVTQPYFTDYEEITERIKRVDGVVRVAPIIDGQLMVSSNTGNSGAIVRGMREQDLRELPAVSQPESSLGNLNNFSSGEGVAVASGLAFKLGIGIGDKITLISPKGASTPFGTTPRVKSYTVQYIFKIGMSDYDNAFIYMPLQEAQLYFNRMTEGGVPGVDMLEVMVDDPENVDDFKEPIGIAAEQPIRVFTWQDSNASFINALNVERNVMFIILTMIILVAALNIISGLIMLVKDKGRDVAILRTIGVPKQAIMRIFFMCGASIGLIGTTAGVLLGLIFCWNIDHIEKAVTWITGAELFSEDIYFLSNLPADVQVGDVLLTTFIAIGLSFAATLYPSWRAARLDPVEALRYE
jgi:lipoprotein-releasing system permease protein